MSTVTILKEIELPRLALVREHSSSPAAEELGKYASTMTLFLIEGTVENGRMSLEWDIPKLDETEDIGIWTESGELTDYDGTICELNSHMISLLESVGIKVGEEFRPDPSEEKKQ